MTHSIARVDTPFGHVPLTTPARRPFGALPPETQTALLRCAEHGAATTSTLMDLVFAKCRKSAKGSPSLRNEKSRINVSSAEKRIATLVKNGYLTRSCATHESTGTPLWFLEPNQETEALAFVSRPTGDRHTGIVRSRVAAGLATKGYSTGRLPELLDIWAGGLTTSGYTCSVCGGQRLLAPTSCPKSIGHLCVLAPTITTERGAQIAVTADVAYLATASTMLRCLIWIDDGRALADQWDELAPLATLPGDASLKVIVRPHGFDSAYSNGKRGWPTMGPRLAKMADLISRAGFAAARGGSFGHRHTVD